MTKLIHHDIDFVKSILPAHYEVKESKKPGSIHCKSNIGISDTHPEDHWKAVFAGIKGRFGYRFQEIFHNTCANHIDFTIHLKNNA